MLVDTSSAIARSVNGMVWCRFFSITNAMGIVCQPKRPVRRMWRRPFLAKIFLRPVIHIKRSTMQIWDEISQIRLQELPSYAVTKFRKKTAEGLLSIYSHEADTDYYYSSKGTEKSILRNSGALVKRCWS